MLLGEIVFKPVDLREADGPPNGGVPSSISSEPKDNKHEDGLFSAVGEISSDDCLCVLELSRPPVPTANPALLN